MGKGFNIKTAFKHSKQSKPQIVIDDEDEEDIQKTSKRNAFHDFFRMNTQKLPRSMKRVGKRKTQVNTAFLKSLLYSVWLMYF